MRAIYDMEFYDSDGFGYATQPLSESRDGLTGARAAIADAKDWLSREPKASYAIVTCRDEALCTIWRGEDGEPIVDGS